jgi:hypothetical protein
MLKICCGSDDERGRKKDHNHKGRQNAKKRHEKIGKTTNEWYTSFDDRKTPLRKKDLAEGLSITLDCLTNLEWSGRIEQTACAIKSEGIYFAKGQADERDEAVNKFYDSFPEFGPAPGKWKTRAMTQLCSDLKVERNILQQLGYPPIAPKLGRSSITVVE